jgi:hypothetical protein
VSGDRHLKNQGPADHAKGSTKNAVDKVSDTLTGRNNKSTRAPPRARVQLDPPDHPFGRRGRRA